MFQNPILMESPAKFGTDPFAQTALADMAHDQLYAWVAAYARRSKAVEFCSVYGDGAGPGTFRFLGWWSPIMGGVFLPAGRA